MNKRKYTFEIILDCDIIENLHDGGLDDITVGLSSAFKKLSIKAYKGFSSDSSMDLHEENGGFWKLPDKGIQIKWEIDYLDEIDWIDHEEG